MANDREEFKFPDETPVNTKEEKVDFEVEGDAQIEVVDDTPEPDRDRPPMKEPPQDVSDEELAKYSDGVKQRIQHFAKGYHEERRAKEAALREREEALRLTQKLLEENQKLQKSAGQSQQVAVEQAKKAVEGELDAARKKYEKAYEDGDAKAILAAQEELFSAKLKAERLAAFKPVQTAPVQTEQNVVQTQPQPDTKALAWRDANPWFGSNRRMTAVALEVHNELVGEGFDPTSDEYYARVNAEMRKVFPEAFPSVKTTKASTVVAPATRSTAPKKIVLTQTQVNLAKRLGLSNEQYARALAEQMRKDNG